MEFQANLDSKKIYTFNEFGEFFHDAIEDFEIKEYTKKEYETKEVITYLNIISSFDIETSSFLYDGKKGSCMYLWGFGLNGLVLQGRTWQEFELFMLQLCLRLNLNKYRRLIVGVHNLGYEFQYIRKHFSWYKVFASDSRKPIYGITENGVEYRDTLILSGYSLETVGKKLTKYHVEKLVGDLDYTLIRHSDTPLSEKECQYNSNDVKVCMAYLLECAEKENGNIAKIPLTKTGYVRRMLRINTIQDKNNKKMCSEYRKLISCLTLQSTEYDMLTRAFQGGFTHASPYYSDEVIDNVQSKDLTSSYPTQLICQDGYPMSKGQFHIVENSKDFFDSLKNYACLFDIEFFDLESKFRNDSYISESKCIKLDNPKINNGRVYSCDYLRTTITEEDFKIISKVYKWSSFGVGTMIRYKRGYLPTLFVKSILELYKDKTELKGLTGYDENGVDYQARYMSSKEMLNSCYGCCVQNPVAEVNEYTDHWEYPKKPELLKALTDYNRNKQRFLFYPWGVWCTAFARVAVWSAILSINDDYIYSDTDSIKYLHPEKHDDYFKMYNDGITRKLEKACEYHNIPIEYIHPKNMNGVEKPLGVWDFDGKYKRFKTLGAKRYMVEDEKGNFSITVSGLNKKLTVPYLEKTYGKDEMFSVFSNGMYIPDGYTGKSTHTYIDDPIDCILTDYTGKAIQIHEECGIHLSESDYSLSLANKYTSFLLGIKESETK